MECNDLDFAIAALTTNLNCSVSYGMRRTPGCAYPNSCSAISSKTVKNGCLKSLVCTKNLSSFSLPTIIGTQPLGISFLLPINYVPFPLPLPLLLPLYARTKSIIPPFISKLGGVDIRIYLLVISQPTLMEEKEHFQVKVDGDGYARQLQVETHNCFSGWHWITSFMVDQ